MAYQLDLVHKAWIHPIFHVSLLKECEGDPLLGNYYSITTHHHWIRTIAVTSSNPLEAYCFKRHHPVQQALNQWEGLSTTGNSWEDVEQLQHSFQQLNLEDKITINGRGNVMVGNALAPRGVNLEAQHMQGSSHAESTSYLVNNMVAEVKDSSPVGRKS